MEGTITFDPMVGNAAQHVYHHSDDGPRVSVKAEKNSKGFNFEAHVSGCKTVDEAMAMLKEATSKLAAEYGATA